MTVVLVLHAAHTSALPFWQLLLSLAGPALPAGALIKFASGEQLYSTLATALYML